MNRIVKDTIKIVLITLIAGILLGLVYQVTKDPIAAAEAKAQQDAYKEVFADAESFEEYNFDEAATAQLLADNGYSDDTINGVVTALDASGNPLGYVITVTSSAGYGGDIQFSIGVTNDGTLNGYAILAISETAGLGMKAKEDAFKSQFENVSGVESFEVTKTGSTSDSEIDAISGATITSRAVTYGVDAGLVFFRSIAEGGN